MAVEDPKIPCWWEKGTWPATVASEIDSAHFEDIRKRMFLLDWPNAGYVDILTTYGKEIPTDPITYMPFDHINWAGSWDAYAAPSVAHPGDLIILFKGEDGVEDLYVNWWGMSESVLDRYPPLGSDGNLDSARWRLAPNPNRYHHYDHNAGRPKIGADGRYIVIFHPADTEHNFLAIGSCIFP
ncbi:unnamed protein product [marine sediment metagenome]|uniref:Uncharacterized protein n=1 Tax=marine sediment metagenome TaxID=412755 RepID=X1TSS8_9ZZZZ